MRLQDRFGRVKFEIILTSRQFFENFFRFYAIHPFGSIFRYFSFSREEYSFKTSNIIRHEPNSRIIYFQDKDADLKEDEEKVELDTKNMKVAELRAELEARGLSSKGELA